VRFTPVTNSGVPRYVRANIWILKEVLSPNPAKLEAEDVINMSRK
jgi:hypothetical protein